MNRFPQSVLHVQVSVDMDVPVTGPLAQVTCFLCPNKIVMEKATKQSAKCP